MRWLPLVALAAAACDGAIMGGFGDAASSGGGDGSPGSDADPGGGRADGAPPDEAQPDGGPPDGSDDAGAGPAQLPPGTHYDLPLDVDGRDRSYAVHVPAGLNGPAPLLIFLHGTNCAVEGDEPAVQRHYVRYTRLAATADGHGFLLALPTSQWREKPGWNDCHFYWSTAEDATFVLALVDDVALRATVDRGRVYLAGFSSGSWMTNYLAATHPDRWAAFGSFAAGYPRDFPAGGQPPAFLFCGTSDSYLTSERALRDHLLSRGWVADETLLYLERDGWEHQYDRSQNEPMWTFLSSFQLP